MNTELKRIWKEAALVQFKHYPDICLAGLGGGGNEHPQDNKSPIFWDTTPCSPLEVNRRFGGTPRLRFQCRRISQTRNQQQLLASRLMLVSCYTALYPKRQDSSKPQL
jgi:hypothetical protein